MVPLSFEDRAATGRYDELAQLFDGDTESLAAVDYGTDFKASSRAWRSGDTKNFTTTFSLAQDARQELVVNFIGEVSPEGTELSARGNAWLKADQVITDKMSVKDVLVLNVPTLATPSLKVIWDNQVQTLESIIEADLPVPLAERVNRWTRPADNNETAIVTTFPPKYRAPDSHFHVVKPKLKRSLATATAGNADTRPEVELGGLYDPALLLDFDPSMFSLVAAKLAQQDVFGADGSLVAPWDMAEKLRPGTLVAVEANLIVYAFCKPSDPSTTFQIQVRRVQVLEESAAPITDRPLLSPVSPAKKTLSKLFSRLSKSLRSAPGVNAETETTTPVRALSRATLQVTSSAASGPPPTKRVTRNK